MSRKKKKKKKKIRDEKLKKVLDISQETRNGIWTIISFALAILAILSFAGEGGRAGEIFSSVAKSLFGWGFFIIPLAFLFLAISFIRSFSRDIYSSALIGTVLMVLAILGVFFIIGENSLDERLIQGGYLGVIFGYPLLTFFGFKAAIIGLLAIMIISILVALDIPIYKLFFKGEKEEKAEEIKDSLVIKQGSQVLNQNVFKKEDFSTSSIEGRSAFKKDILKQDEEGTKDFVIKSSIANKEWKLPPPDLLHDDMGSPKAGDIAQNANIIRRTFANFGIDVEMGEVNIGPTVAQYTLRPAVGVKVSQITALQNDLALALATHPIRIEAPIPGKSLIGIEAPNKKVALLGLKGLIEEDEYKKSNYFFPLALGKDVAGYPVFAPLERMPHLLIAGATGTGKSVAINSVLLSLLYKYSPDIVKFILVDPKRVELNLYDGIPHLITPVIVDAKKTINALRWAVKEMERRYEIISNVGSRDIFSFNVLQSSKKESLMPFIVIVIDELADIMAAHGREVEGAVVRLAQMSRAVGIHLVISTQRPSVEVITGLIKANITSRLAFQVASQVDSRTILDTAGAEQLLGNGDMLYQTGDSSKPKRIQGAFVSEKEVKAVVKFLKSQEYEEGEEAEFKESFEEGAAKVTIPEGSYGDFGDSLYNDAKEVVILAGKASASLLQRRLRIGYARAARLIDMLEEKGIVGPGEGAKPREILVKLDNQRDNQSIDQQPGSDTV